MACAAHRRRRQGTAGPLLCWAAVVLTGPLLTGPLLTGPLLTGERFPVPQREAETRHHIELIAH